MKRFIQLHILTSYPPSNLNRDDLGRPKTAKMGGFDRLRISSQSLKRAWRTSDLFQNALDGHIGTRTKRIGIEIKDKFLEKGVEAEKAKEWAKVIAEQFGKLKKANKKKPDEDLEIEQLAHISPEEWNGIDALIDLISKEKRAPKDKELELLKKNKAVDIAFFGRMLADSPANNIEAAVQVSHAVTINASAVEDDYFTAVDDLNIGDEDSGAAHIGESGFGSGVFYIYICINRELLLENLSDDNALANKAISAFIEAASKIAPSGKQNSFASRAYASYILAECGAQQPRSLSVAFLKPITGNHILKEGIKALESQREKMEKVYGKCADSFKMMNVEDEIGTLEEIIKFVTE